MWWQRVASWRNPGSQGTFLLIRGTSFTVRHSAGHLMGTFCSVLMTSCEINSLLLNSDLETETQRVK